MNRSQNEVNPGTRRYTFKPAVFLHNHSGVGILTKEGIIHYTKPPATPFPMNKTSFIVSAGDVFSHVTGDNRVIVLTQEAFAHYMSKFPEESNLYAETFDLRYDKSRKAAVLNLFELNSGETLLMWKKNGHWFNRETGSIICD